MCVYIYVYIYIYIYFIRIPIEVCAEIWLLCARA